MLKSTSGALLLALIATVAGCRQSDSQASREDAGPPCPSYPATPDASLPPEIKTKGAELNYCKAPDGYHAVTAWIHAIHDTTANVASAVRLDRIRLLGRRRDGSATVIAQQQYEDMSEVCGGLYHRKRWYEKDESLPLQNVKIERGAAVLPVSEVKDRVWHVYLCQLAPLTEDFERIWMEANVAIDGAALLQAGLDYWPTADPTAAIREDGCDARRICQGATSDWYRARPGIVRVTVGEP